MISEGTRDTADRSNICWKFSFAISRINDFLKYIIEIENSYFKFKYFVNLF